MTKCWLKEFEEASKVSNTTLNTRIRGVLTAVTINEPHFPKKKRPRCYVKSPTAQDTWYTLRGCLYVVCFLEFQERLLQNLSLCSFFICLFVCFFEHNGIPSGKKLKW